MTTPTRIVALALVGALTAPAVARADLGPARERIESAIAEGRLDEAGGMLAGLRVGPGDDGDLHEIGQRFLKADRRDLALRAYERILDVDPNDRRALYWKGTIHRWNGESDQALATLDRLLTIDPDHYDGLTARARVHIAQESWAKAEADLYRAERASPGNRPVAEMLARVLTEQGRIEEAQGWIGRTTPGADYYFSVAELHRSRGDLEQAHEYYDYALRVDGAHADTHRALGDLAREADDDDRALDHYALSLEANPNQPTTWFWYGTLQRRRGDETEARHAFRRALEIDEGHTDALVGAGRVENFWGNPDLADELSRKVIAKSPGYVEAHSNLGRAHELRNRPHDAYDAYTDGFHRTEKDAEPWRGHWRNAERIFPNVGARWTWSSSKVVEGRNEPQVRTEYSGWSVEVDGRMPVTRTFTLVAEAEYFNDVLDNRDTDQTIYDVDGIPVLGGFEWWMSPHWRLTSLAGVGFFESNTPDPVDEDNLVLTKNELAYFDWENRFDASVGFDRGHILGRSIAGDVDFVLLAQNRAYAKFDKRLGDDWRWRGNGSFLDYSRGGEKIAAGTDLTFSAGWFRTTGYVRFFPLQTRFLRGDPERIAFVDTFEQGVSADVDVGRWTNVFGEYRYSDYSDENRQEYRTVGVAFRQPWFEPLSFGVQFEDADFRQESSDYDSYDYEALSPFARLNGTIVPRLDYDVRYTHGFRVEDGFGSFDDETFRWALEYFFNTWLRIGTDGRWGFNEIDEDRRKVSLFGRIVF